MKRSITPLLLGLFLSATLFSCNKDDEEISVEAGIVGTWTVASVEMAIDGKSLDTYIDEMIDQMATQMGDDFTPEMEAQYREMFSDINLEDEMANTSIEFRSDKTAMVTDENGTEPGTWSLSNDDLTVTFEDEAQTFEVRNMTKSSASLHSSFQESLDATSSMTIESIINLKK